jgi:hypothetical protein
MILIMIALYIPLLDIGLTPPAAVDLSQCPARVTDQQAALFSEDIYFEQFNYTRWNASLIWRNDTLCSFGFDGNSDAYGLGLRIGLYLQWLSSLLANQISANTRSSLSQAYLFFSLAIFVTIMVMTANSDCNFAIELVILYIMYFGGYFCVYHQPNLTSKDDPLEWQGLTWSKAVTHILYSAMAGHAAWFWPVGYTRHFIKMPCGTTNFFFGPMSDEPFTLLRFLLGFASFCGAVEFAIFYPLFVILFLEEIKRSIKESALYKGLFPLSQYTRIEEQEDSGREALMGNWWTRFVLWHKKMRGLEFLKLGLFREPLVIEGKAKV